MNVAAKAQEPSMEEILASIRRIIADDDATKSPVKAPEAKAPPQKAPEPQAEPAAMNQDDIDSMLAGLDAPISKPAPAQVLDLTEMVEEEPEPKPTNFRPVAAEPDLVMTEPKPAPKMAVSSPPMDAGQALISSATMATVGSAFNSLAQTVLVQNATTLEDLVKEMLRPMLKSWLDDNLPVLVERLVRAEIERVARGRD